MKKIKVLLVDDHNIVRNGLKLILQLNPYLEVSGEAETLNQAMDEAVRINPDVILLDFKLPDGDGIQGCIHLKRKLPNVKIIILTAYAQEHIVMETIRAGADGYLLKDIEGDELIKSIFCVHEGGSVLAPSVTEGVFNKIKKENEESEMDFELSQKEQNILDLISLGKVNKEIACEMNISDKTVRNYVSIIFKKINVSNRTEAAVYWIETRALK